MAAEYLEVAPLGAGNHGDAELTGEIQPIWVTPERDSSTGMPICATLITISEVSRPVV